MLNFKIYVAAFSLLAVYTLIPTNNAVLFPQFTLFQVTVAVSWPIPYKSPDRKIFFNTGFQFNYGEPFSPSNFYMPTYFQSAFSRSIDDPELSKVDGSNATRTVSGNQTEIQNSTLAEDERKDKLLEAPKESRLHVREAKEIAGQDLTAGELYNGIEENIEAIGYDRSCLLKSICELARHPLHLHDDDNFLEDMLHFILTPTEHSGFSKDEQSDRERYEEAEMAGNRGYDCDLVYSECTVSFLDRITYLLDRTNVEVEKR